MISVRENYIVQKSRASCSWCLHLFTLWQLYKTNIRRQDEGKERLGKESDSLQVARLFRDRVWKDFGLPEVVISDRGSQFVSRFMKDLYQSLRVKLNPSMAYHLQTDGQTVAKP